MGVRSSIKNGVDSAFKVLAELAVPVVFSKNEVSSFDFGAGEVKIDSSSTLNTVGFTFYGKNNLYVQELNSRSNRSLQLLVKTEGNSFNFYTKVLISGKQYKPSLISSDEFITIFSLQES
jgi:hypothetical protein